MKYFLYARKSTDTEDKQVLSIEAQLSELAEHAEKERLEIARKTAAARAAGRAKFCSRRAANSPDRFGFFAAAPAILVQDKPTVFPSRTSFSLSGIAPDRRSLSSR